MDLFEKNLEALPELKIILPGIKDKFYETEESRSGSLTLKINNIYIHSKYDPQKEAKRIVELLLHDKEELDALIIYGNGLGYAAKLIFDEFIKNNKFSVIPYIIYIEADIRIFLTSIKHFDWTEIVSNSNFKIFLESDKVTIGSFVQTIPTKRIRYYYHRPSYHLHENYYKEVQKYISYVLDRKDMNTATFTRFQRLWTKNFLYNLPVYFNSNKIKELSGAGKNIPAVVIAGGPTLEKCLSYLKSINDKAIIIAVDTAYKYLKKNSIKPDIVVTIDLNTGISNILRMKQ